MRLTAAVAAFALAAAACGTDDNPSRAKLTFSCTSREDTDVIELHDVDGTTSMRAECVQGRWVVDINGDGLRDN